MIIFGMFFSVLSQIIFWMATLLVLVRIYRAAGWGTSGPLAAPISKNSALAWMRSLIVVDENLTTSERKQKTPYGKIILFALGVRLVMLILGYTILVLDGQSPSVSDLFYAFRRGDSTHYLNLAEIGYTWTENDKHLLLVFFPLYGWLIRLIHVPVGHYLAAAYIVSFVSFALALCYFYRLIRCDFKASVARWGIVLISIAPHSFFFGVPMTESLFLLTTVMCLYYIRTHNWPLAGIIGAFAILTRMMGLVLIVVAAVEFMTHYKVFDLVKQTKWESLRRLIARKGAWILVMLFGVVIYLLVNWHVTGDPFQFMYYQRTHWHNQFTYFGSVIILQFESIVYAERSFINTIAVPNILAFAVTALMLLYAGVKRLNPVYIVFLLGYAFISFSVSWLLSGGRYMAAAAPLFLFLAHFTEKRPVFRILVPIVFLIGLLMTMRWYLLGGTVF
ncbi:MAG: glycosyltransferase family 39 protein [Oscillospiraceae bacterium]|nr:glycosyltransferase family 39 protein [Oscillospiraceae bacterium]